VSALPAEVRSRSLPSRQITVGWLSRNGIFFALLLLVGYFALASERFFTASNFEVVLVQTSIVGIIAIPGAMLVLAGYVDLSVGSLTVLSAIVFGSVFDAGGSIVLAAVVALCVSFACGLITATLVAIFGMSPIIVTLGGLAAARGVAEVVSQGETVFGFGTGFAWVGNGEILGVRFPAWTFLIFVALGAYVWYQSPYGRHMMAIGSNRDAAHSLGIAIRRLPFILYVVSALACGVAGLLYASRLDGASLSIGDGLELQVLTAILLGGVAFTGGRGTLLGVVCGLLFVSVLTNGLAQLDVSSYWVNIALGSALILAAGVDVLYQRLERLPPPDTDGEEAPDAVRTHP
jgi:ribose transport system permease protein